VSAEARGALRQFVLDRNPGLTPQALGDDTPLLTERLVTSLHLVDMLLLLESMRRAPIDVRRMSPSSFRTIDSIVTTFLGAEG
jgi:hypothetical protein